MRVPCAEHDWDSLIHFRKPPATLVRIDKALPFRRNREAVKHRSPGSAGTAAQPWSAAPPWVSDPLNPSNPGRVPQWSLPCATLSGNAVKHFHKGENAELYGRARLLPSRNRAAARREPRPPARTVAI